MTPCRATLQQLAALLGNRLQAKQQPHDTKLVRFGPFMLHVKVQPGVEAAGPHLKVLLDLRTLKSFKHENNETLRHVGRVWFPVTKPSSKINGPKEPLKLLL